MFYFEVTPQTRILLELLVIVFAGMIALVIENPGARTAPAKAPATVAKVAPGH